MSTMSIESIAEWYLSKETMTQKKLQKLCYYAVAWGWALMEKPIAKNSDFQAWIHGPASPVLYSKYKSYGWNLIPAATTPNNIPADIDELLKSVWATYGDKDGNELEALSHSEDPWKAARVGLSETERGSKVIDSDIMTKYYRSIYTGDE